MLVGFISLIWLHLWLELISHTLFASKVALSLFFPWTLLPLSCLLVLSSLFVVIWCQFLQYSCPSFSTFLVAKNCPTNSSALSLALAPSALSVLSRIFAVLSKKMIYHGSGICHFVRNLSPSCQPFPCYPSGRWVHSDFVDFPTFLHCGVRSCHG